jgi:hypothetical protein
MYTHTHTLTHTHTHSHTLTHTHTYTHTHTHTHTLTHTHTRTHTYIFVCVCARVRLSVCAWVSNFIKKWYFSVKTCQFQVTSNTLSVVVIIFKVGQKQRKKWGQGKLTYPFSAERTIISTYFCWVLEGWVRRSVRGHISREGGQDTGVGRSSSI